MSDNGSEPLRSVRSQRKVNKQRFGKSDLSLAISALTLLLMAVQSTIFWVGLNKPMQAIRYQNEMASCIEAGRQLSHLRTEFLSFQRLQASKDELFSRDSFKKSDNFLKIAKKIEKNQNERKETLVKLFKQVGTKISAEMYVLDPELARILGSVLDIRIEELASLEDVSSMLTDANMVLDLKCSLGR